MCYVCLSCLLWSRWSHSADKQIEMSLACLPYSLDSMHIHFFCSSSTQVCCENLAKNKKKKKDSFKRTYSSFVFFLFKKISTPFFSFWRNRAGNCKDSWWLTLIILSLSPFSSSLNRHGSLCHARMCERIFQKKTSKS